MKAILTKIYQFKGKERTDMPNGYTYIGEYSIEPRVGDRFVIGSLITSTVVQLLPNNHFQTSHSIYQLEETK